MYQYRDVIYGDYFSNQVNKEKVDYKKILAVQERQLKLDILPFLPLDKDASIIDIGCGFGSLIHTMKRAGYTNLEGIDLSAEQVEVAHKLNFKEIKEESLESWLSKNEKKDCIVAVDLVEHLSKDEFVTFLAQLRSALNPGGKIILRTPNMDAPQMAIYAMGDFSHETLLNKNSALQVMASLGFKNVRVEGGKINNQNAATNWFRALLWSVRKFGLKLDLWTSGRTWNSVVFEPNLLIVGSV